jgi:hypothetical protein
MNYVFFSLQRSLRLDGNLESLFRRFWDRYLTQSSDAAMLRVAAPFFAFRGLVMASPVWYPTMDESVRVRLFNFIRNVLSEAEFNPAEVNRYCEG